MLNIPKDKQRPRKLIFLYPFLASLVFMKVNESMDGESGGTDVCFHSKPRLNATKRSFPTIIFTQYLLFYLFDKKQSNIRVWTIQPA